MSDPTKARLIPGHGLVMTVQFPSGPCEVDAYVQVGVDPKTDGLRPSDIDGWTFRKLMDGSWLAVQDGRYVWPN